MPTPNVLPQPGMPSEGSLAPLPAPEAPTAAPPPVEVPISPLTESTPGIAPPPADAVATREAQQAVGQVPDLPPVTDAVSPELTAGLPAGEAAPSVTDEVSPSDPSQLEPHVLEGQIGIPETPPSTPPVEAPAPATAESPVPTPDPNIAELDTAPPPLPTPPPTAAPVFEPGDQQPSAIGAVPAPPVEPLLATNPPEENTVIGQIGTPEAETDEFEALLNEYTLNRNKAEDAFRRLMLGLKNKDGQKLEKGSGMDLAA